MLNALRAGHRSGRLYLGLSAASAVGAAGFAFSTYREQKQNEQLQKEFDVLIAKERVEATRQQAAKTEQMRDVREAKYVSNEARDHRLDSRLAVSATAAAAAARRCLPLK